MAHFGLILGSDLAQFWLHFGSIVGPPSGGRFERKTMNSNGFGAFRPPKKAQFWGRFRRSFWLSCGSIFAPFGGPFWEAGRPPFHLVLGLAWPAPGAEARKSSPGPS